LKKIEEGEFFPIRTKNQKKALRFLLAKLRKGKKDKGRLTRVLHQKEIYKQEKDCRDFIMNCIRSENIEIVAIGQRRIALTGHLENRKKEVK